MKAGWLVAVSASTLCIASCADDKNPINGCAQGAEAVHYIAAKARSASDVPRVVGEVVAERKFPALDDKQVALVGQVVIVAWGTKTPDELSAQFKAKCESNSRSKP